MLVTGLADGGVGDGDVLEGGRMEERTCFCGVRIGAMALHSVAHTCCSTLWKSTLPGIESYLELWTPFNFNISSCKRCLMPCLGTSIQLLAENPPQGPSQ